MSTPISTPEQLEAINWTGLYGDYYLTNDIDLTGYGDWNGIGNSASTFASGTQTSRPALYYMVDTTQDFTAPDAPNYIGKYLRNETSSQGGLILQVLSSTTLLLDSQCMSTRSEVDSGTTTSQASWRLIDSSQNFLTTVKVGDIIETGIWGVNTYVSYIYSDTELGTTTNIITAGMAYEISSWKNDYVIINPDTGGFSGTFDGMGYDIIGFELAVYNGNSKGLFSNSNGAIFQNVNFVNPRITVGNVSNLYMVGVLIGHGVDSTFTDCSITGLGIDVNSNTDGDFEAIGGMAGLLNNCTLTNIFQLTRLC